MTRKLRVVATVPGKIPYSSISMELEVTIRNGENIRKTTDNMKELLAELISGEDPDIYSQALTVLNHPDNTDKLTEKKKEFVQRKAELNKLETEVKHLRHLIERYMVWRDSEDFIDRLEQVISRLKQNPELSWVIIKDVFPETEDREIGDVYYDEVCDDYEYNEQNTWE